MSMDGPCSVLRGGSMRGLSAFNSGGDIFSNRAGQPHSNMAIRCGGPAAAPAPAPAASSSTAWDANDEPLADIDTSLPDMLTAPTLRSVSSLFMSIDAAEEGVSCSSADQRNRTNTIANSSSAGGGGGAGERDKRGVSSAVERLMTSLPAPPTPMGSCDNLVREQSFPPPFRPRFARDQSFPPPVQAGGLTVDMLPSTSAMGGGGGGWSHGGGSTAVMTGSVFGGGGGGGGGGSGGGSGLRKFQGLGFPDSVGSTSTTTSTTTSASSSSNSGAPLQMKQPSPWGGDDAGGRGHPGGGSGGTGGGSLGDKEQHPFGMSASSASHPRRPSFDTLAGMIPGIPSSWPALSPSAPSTQTQSSSSSAPAGELRVHVDGGVGRGGNGGGSNITSASKAKPTFASAQTHASRSPVTAGYSSSSTSSLSPSPSRSSSPPSRGRSSRPGKKPKKHHLRRADSPPPVRWNASAASPPAVTNPIKKSPSSGTGKRGVEPPPSCGPVRAGGGPADLAQLERRRVKIQRYLYKRSRRKFAKSTRDASPSRSRPKAAALRPRVKGKFVKTVPDFISVNAGQQPGEEGEGGAKRGVSAEASGGSSSSKKSFPPATFHAVAPGGVGVAGKGSGGGGVRSVRNGGSVNVNLDGGKAFSTTPPSSLMPRGVSGGGVLPPAVSALSNGAPNSLAWSTGGLAPMSM